MSERKENPQEYPEIVRLEPREHVRKRPGMYIGGTNKQAMHYLIYEIVDHSIGLVFVGLCNHIWVTLRDNNEVCIRDNGLEIPDKIDERTGKVLLEAFMTEVSVSDDRVHEFTNERYRGMLSTGFLAINALSEQLTIESTYKGYLWKQEYRVGIPQSKVTQVRALKPDEPKGMAITLQPDFTILEPHDFDYDAIVSRLRETAYLAPSVTITVVDERKYPSLKTEFHFPNGMADVVRDCNAGQTVLHKIIHYQEIWVMEAENRREEIEVEFALQYTDSNETVIKSYVNTWCMDGGTQIQGLQSAMVDVINSKAANSTEKPFTWDEVKGGLTVGLNVKLIDPSFESQTKINLINPTAYDAVAKVIYDGLNLVDQRDDGQELSKISKAIIEKCKANRNMGRL